MALLGMSISIELDSTDKVKVAFDMLKTGGAVTMELQQTFWSKCFGSVKDKFGVNWMISIGA